MKHKVFMGATLCALLGACLLAATPRPRAALGMAGAKSTSDSSGVSGNGLQIGLAVEPGVAQSMLVVFRNVGERDTLLSLGEMLNNGREQIPSQVRFVLTDAAGKKDTASFWDGRAGIGGHVDEYRVPLRAGSSYSLKFKLNELWSSSAQGLASKLKSGKYQVVARFSGVGEKARNRGQKDIGLMNYWKGNCQSNIVTLEK